MSDLFDDFMRELRRRQQEAAGVRPGPDETPGEADDEAPPGDDDLADDARSGPDAGPDEDAEPEPIQRRRPGEIPRRS